MRVEAGPAAFSGQASGCALHVADRRSQAVTRVNQDRFTHRLVLGIFPCSMRSGMTQLDGRLADGLWLGLSARPVYRRGQMTRAGSRPVVGILPTLGRQALTSLPTAVTRNSWPMRASSHLDGCCGHDSFPR
jgi:hypothetical protein